MKKRILSLAIVMAMLLASCSETSTVNTDTQTDGTSTDTVSADNTGDTAEETPIPSDSESLIAVEENYDWKENVKQTDYQGYEYTILNGCTATWYQYNTVIAEELTGEPVSDAVYTRQSRTEDYLNVKVNELVDSDSAAKLKTGVKAGTNDFDLALCTLMGDFALGLDGYCYDINSVESMDLSQNWFDQNSVRDLTINNKIFFLTSDFDTTRFDSIRSLYFNKDLIKNNGLENPYELVDNNHWVIDKFIEMCHAGESDTDGDGIMTDADNYGYVTYNEIAIDLLTCGSNLHYLAIDPDTGYIVDGSGSEKFYNTYSKIYSLLYDSQCVFDVKQSRYSAYLNGRGDRQQEVMFLENKAIFYSECMAWTKALREMESDFGVVPPPKYDESQDRYYSIILNPFMQIIPSSLSAEDAEKSGAILNCLAAASHDTVVDAYVNVTLQNKVTRDPDSVRMLHLVFDELSYNLHYDAGVRNAVVNGMSSGNAEIASALAKNAKMITKSLKKVNEKIYGE